MKRVKLAKNELIPGEPVQWSIYDPNGQLLLRQGVILESVDIVNKIFQHDPYRNEEMILSASNKHKNKVTVAPETIRVNPFNQITRFTARLKNIIKDIKDQDPDIEGRILKLARDIQKLVAYDEDACLGAIHLYYDQQYSLLQPIYKAMLCELTATLMGYDHEKRLPMLAAALTANIALIDLQESLNRQKSPLSPAQRDMLKNAPATAVEMLKQCGVQDSVWLNTVIQNHERNDGSGYPWGLKSAHISTFAKILGLADTYAAMVSERIYREDIMPKQALRTIYKMSTKEDETIYVSFIRQLGTYPPGTLVLLNNEEIAVVTYRGYGATIMGSASSIGKPGHYYIEPFKRDTSLEEFGIAKAYFPKSRPKLNPDLLWGYE